MSYHSQGAMAIDSTIANIKGSLTTGGGTKPPPGSTTPEIVPTPNQGAAALAPKSRILLWGSIALLGVGGFLYYRRRQKPKTSVAPKETP